MVFFLPSDWSIQKILRADWLRSIRRPPILLTLKVFFDFSLKTAISETQIFCFRALGEKVEGEIWQLLQFAKFFFDDAANNAIFTAI